MKRSILILAAAALLLGTGPAVAAVVKDPPADAEALARIRGAG